MSDGRVYTFGATGILNALDARDGTVVWSRNVASDTGADIPYWGFVVLLLKAMAMQAVKHWFMRSLKLWPRPDARSPVRLNPR